MKDPETERQIGETMAEVFRERLVELETLAGRFVTKAFPFPRRCADFLSSRSLPSFS
jgi:hypothetical protein